jgi:hypothetical protein
MNIKQFSILFGLLALLLSSLYAYRVNVPQAQKDALPIELTPSPENQNAEKLVYKNTSAEDIEVELPTVEGVTGKEFGIIGKARGPWFFEGTFPLEVQGADGGVLAVGYATALGEWMTEDFVRFVSEVKVPDTYSGPATVVLKKENPSGEPQRDASVSFTITIAP